jgi:DNA gyrase subunit B/topoisomerase-4 subunit B
MNEYWKDVKGYEGIYEASTTGHVRIKPGANSPEYVKKRGFVIPDLKYFTDKHNRLKCVFVKRDGSRHLTSPHRLVAWTFLPNPANLREVNHIDGNPQNNDVSNLEWVSSSENKHHAVRMGLMLSGEAHPQAKLTNDQVTELKIRVLSGEHIKDLAEEFNVQGSLISTAVNETYYRTTSDKAIDIDRYRDKHYNSNHSKLNRDQVKEIRRLYGKEKWKIWKLAEYFNVDRHTISNALDGITYPLDPGDPVRNVRGTRKTVKIRDVLSKDEVYYIRDMYKLGWTYNTLSAKMHKSEAMIYRCITTDEVPYRKGESAKTLKAAHDAADRNNRTPLTKEELQDLRAKIATHKYTTDELMVMFGIENLPDIDRVKNDVQSLSCTTMEESQMTDSYTSSDIREFTFMEHTRRNAGMLMGKTNLNANIQCVKEYIDNSVDESIDPNRIYHINVILFKGDTTYQIAVLDHGRGIPCEKLRNVFTIPFSTGKADSAAYKYSIGQFGVGAVSSNAISERFVAITKRLDGFAGLTLNRGNVVKSEVMKPIDSIRETVGTIVVHQPDDTILRYTHTFFPTEGVQRLFELVDYIGAFKTNTKFHIYQVDKLLPDSWFKKPYEDMWNYFQKQHGTLIYETPMMISAEDYVRGKFNITEQPLWNLEVKQEVTSPKLLACDISVHLVKNCDRQNGYIATVNDTQIKDKESSHLSVFFEKIRERLTPYLDQDDDEIMTFFERFYNIPFYGYIRAFYKGATYEGQTKHGFKDLDFEKIYGQMLNAYFDTIQDGVWEQMFNIIHDDLVKKFAQFSNKSMNLSSNSKNLAYDMNNEGCYVPARVTDPTITELFITEGNSAGDFVVQERFKHFQAVLKLKGKPINAHTANVEDLRANKVYQDLVKILGVGPRDQDLSRLRFARIGILADADPDGYHINDLVITALLKINPLILASGRVFMANPPLYVMESRDKALFLRDQKALNDARVKIYEKFFNLELYSQMTKNLCQLKGEQYRDFIYLTKRIGGIITRSANKLVIDPMVLEQLVHCVDYLSLYKLDTKMVKNILKLDDCSYHPGAKTLLLSVAGIEISVPMQNLVQEIRSYILPELEMVHWELFDLLVTTKTTTEMERAPMTFMQLYRILQKLDEHYPVHRLKGLGECSGPQLKYTCLDPATRTFTTITSIGDVNRIYDMMGVDTAPRKALVLGDVKSILNQIPEQEVL